MSVKTNNRAKAMAAITPELRLWIGEQTRAGHGPQVLLESMKASGWQEDTALDALEIVLAEMLEAQKVAALQPVPVPEPPVAGSPSRIWAHDREVGVVMTMSLPRVIVFSGLLSDAECDELIELARVRLARSHTVDTATGESEVNEARTSDGMFFARAENELCARIEARLAALCGWPIENGEGLQVLHYRPGAEYKPHYDYFDPAKPGTPVILKRGGQRVATIVTYLNTPEAGGATTFPDVSLEVAAIKGNAVFFSYDRPDPVTKSLHGGAPVVAGEKWVATKWLRSGRFE